MKKVLVLLASLLLLCMICGMASAGETPVVNVEVVPAGAGTAGMDSTEPYMMPEANEGYVFANITEKDTGRIVHTSSDWVFYFDEYEDGTTLVVNFIKEEEAVLLKTAANASCMIEGANRYVKIGETVQISFEMDESRKNQVAFTGWTLNGVIIGTDPVLNYTVTPGKVPGEARTICAIFRTVGEVDPSETSLPQGTRTLEVEHYPAGAGTDQAAGEYAAGAHVTLEAVANPGYTFSHWECGDFTYDSARLEIGLYEDCVFKAVYTTAPVVKVQPKDATVKEGEKAAFSVEAEGIAPLTYQWQVNTSHSMAKNPRLMNFFLASAEAAEEEWINITGANSATFLTDPALLSWSGRQYRCVLTDGNGGVTITDDATLTVISNVPETGDGFRPAAWMLLLAMGLACALLLNNRQRRTN